MILFPIKRNLSLLLKTAMIMTQESFAGRSSSGRCLLVVGAGASLTAAKCRPPDVCVRLVKPCSHGSLTSKGEPGDHGDAARVPARLSESFTTETYVQFIDKY